jgi:hypothetical protein
LIESRVDKRRGGLVGTTTNAKEVGKLVDVETAEKLAYTLIESRFNELALSLLELHNTILDRGLDQNTMDLDGSLLSDVVSSVDSLHLDEWIPEWIKDNNSRGGDQVETGIASL